MDFPKVKQAEVPKLVEVLQDFTQGQAVTGTRLEGSEVTKVKQAEVAKLEGSDFPKVKQAEVTNGHKLLFCKMNQMSHCCVEVLQVFTPFISVHR